MEIHAPHGPIMTLREFLVHLLVVTAGILIALGLEQSVEMLHHHNLAREARENMLAEIRDNRKDLENHMAGFEKFRKERNDDIALIDRLLAHQHLTHMQTGLAFSGGTLSSASWTTASTVGALSYMDYDEVKRFAGVYKLQEMYDRLEGEQIGTVQTGIGMLNLLNEGPEKVTEGELRAIKQQLLQASASLTVISQVAQQLDAEYGKLVH